MLKNLDEFMSVFDLKIEKEVEVDQKEKIEEISRIYSVIQSALEEELIIKDFFSSFEHIRNFITGNIIRTNKFTKLSWLCIGKLFQSEEIVDFFIKKEQIL